MDHYPQPRPVLYGTSAEEAPPQTQTKPVRMEPPRWPPAPPHAGEWGDDGDSGEPWRRRYAYQSARATRSSADAPGRYVVATLYALASLYAIYQLVFMPRAIADMPLASRLFLLLQIIAATWVVPCLITLAPPTYLMALGVALAQTLLGVIAREWFSPGLLAAAAICFYLLRPSMLVTPRARAAWDTYARVTRSGAWRRQRRGVHFSRPVPPDDWQPRPW